MSSKMMVFTGNANPELAQKVASRLYLSLGKADVGQFSDGEVAVELNENVHHPVDLQPSERQPDGIDRDDRRPQAGISAANHRSGALLWLRAARSPRALIAGTHFRQGGCGYDGHCRR